MTAKRYISVALIIFMMVAGVAGCKNEAEEEFEDFEGSITADAYTISVLDDVVYTAQALPIPDDIEFFNEIAYRGDKVFFASTVYDYAGAEGSYRTTSTADIYTVDIDGTAPATALPNYEHPAVIPDDESGSLSVSFMDFDNEGELWVLETWYFYRFELPDGFADETDDPWEHTVTTGFGIAARKLGADGAELLSVDISSLPALSVWGSSGVSAFAVTANPETGDEIIVVNCTEGFAGKSTVYVLNTDGDILFSHEPDVFIDTFIKMPDGSVAFPLIEDFETDATAQELQIIDIAAGTLGEKIRLPDVGLQVFGGSGEFDILISDYESVYGYNFGANEVTRLLGWLDNNIISDGISDIILTAHGDFVCKKYVWSGANAGKTQILVITKMLQSELPEKITLTLATFQDLSFSPLRNHIVNFNNTSLLYNIEVIDYSQYYSDDSPDAAITKLNNDIIAGNAPDIFLLSYDMPFRDYVSQGLFVDFYPLIDADPDFSRDDFFENVFKAAEIDGGLYRLFPEFYIITIVGDKSVTGPEMGWTMDEFRAVLDEHPEADMPLGPWMTKNALLSWYVNAYSEDFIDWDTGTVSFDSPEFIQLLEASGRISTYSRIDENPYADMPFDEAIATGRQIMWYTIIGDFRDIYDHRINYGWDVAFKGLPVDSRDGHIISASPDTDFAISAQSPNIDAAWEFVRMILYKDWRLDEAMAYGFGFPVNKAAFEDKTEEALRLGYANQFTWDGEKMQPDPPPAEEDLAMMRGDIDKVSEVIESASRMSSGGNVDEILYNIIMDGAADYFNGLISAGEAARIIQSSASLYVSERS